jgi:hypothetical protein
MCMKIRTLVLILTLATLILGAYARPSVAQSIPKIERGETARGDPTVTEGVQPMMDPAPTSHSFATLLGPVRTPDGWSVRPCSREETLLCVYQGRTLLGIVELTTVRHIDHSGFKKALSDAGIPLGSVDYTDPTYAPQAPRALTAHAAAALADRTLDRELADEAGYALTLAATTVIQIGRLPGVVFGFASIDPQGRTLERWLTYAAFDNDALYLFTAFYSPGMPRSFVSDEQLLRFDPYLRQILARLRLPVGEDWRSPGAELTNDPRLLIQRPDDSIQYVTLDGSSAVLVAEAPSSLLPAGYSGVPYGGAPMMDGPMVYLRQWSGGFYALDTKLGVLFPMDFIPFPSPLLAVRPLTEGLLPEGAPISLAWGEFSASHTATATLRLSAPDGSQAIEALQETYGASDPWTQFVPWRWRQDGRLFLTKQPVGGMGGFPAFVGADNLRVFDPKSGESTELISHDVTGGRLCLDAIAPDDRLIVHHCDRGQITLLDLETGKSSAASLPAPVTSDMELGSVRFSPDGSRIAFAAMTGGFGLPEETRGYIAVSDSLSLSGVSRLIVTSEPRQWFSIAAWLSADRLVLQSRQAGPDGLPAVWTVRTDGSGLVKLAEGTFLAAFGG